MDLLLTKTPAEVFTVGVPDGHRLVIREANQVERAGYTYDGGLSAGDGLTVVEVVPKRMSRRAALTSLIAVPVAAALGPLLPAGRLLAEPLAFYKIGEGGHFTFEKPSASTESWEFFFCPSEKQVALATQYLRETREPVHFSLTHDS